MTGFVDLRGSVAVITGAGGGVGRAAAIALAERGAQIVVTDIDGDRANKVADEVTALAADAVSAACDVADVTAIEHIRDLAPSSFGHLGIVMNNVGVLAVGPPR